MMVVAFLVFEAGLCRDDPKRILSYPLHQLLFWFDLCVGWRKESTKMTEKQQREAQAASRVAQPVTRPFPR